MVNHVRAAFDKAVRLTPAEHRVLLRVLLGETNKEIARVLACSPKTVEFHLAHIFEKSGVDGRTRLVSAVAMGLVRTEPPAIAGRVAGDST